MLIIFWTLLSLLPYTKYTLYVGINFSNPIAKSKPILLIRISPWSFSFQGTGLNLNFSLSPFLYAANSFIWSFAYCPAFADILPPLALDAIWTTWLPKSLWLIPLPSFLPVFPNQALPPPPAPPLCAAANKPIFSDVLIELYLPL